MTYCSVVEVFALVGLTKKRFGHYAILKILSLRSPKYPGGFCLGMGAYFLVLPETFRKSLQTSKGYKKTCQVS